MTRIDLAITGAGPAGMAAAGTAAKYGASVALLDEQASPGGQIYRKLEHNLSHASELHKDALGVDYLAGQGLIKSFRNKGDNLRYLPQSTVWRIGIDGSVSYTQQVAGESRSARLQARQIVIANGALERPVPVPGWTLAGVLTAGGAQILLKSSALLPQRAVLVGSGPLLYLFAHQLIAAKASPLAILETQSTANYLSALRHLPVALRGWKNLAKGMTWLKQIRSSDILRFSGVSDLVLEGDGQVEKVSFLHAHKRHEIACSTVLLHQGVVPNTQLTRSLGLAHKWNAVQRCFEPLVSEWGESSRDNISVAGDGAQVFGAKAAALSGELTALNALLKLGIISQIERDKKAAKIKKLRQTETSPRRFLDVLYAPPQALLTPADETIVCRCEEVTAGDIRSYVALGCVGPNQTNAFGSCGMGPCQGRFCAATVTEIIADAAQIKPAEVGSYRIRSPVKPVTLAELAALANSTTDTDL